MLPLIACEWLNFFLLKNSKGIYARNVSSLIINGGEISLNNAIGGSGGGLYLTNNTYAFLSGVIISSNNATDSGGGKVQ